MTLPLFSRMCHQAASMLLYGLLLFTPLARGSVHPWAQTVILLAVVLLLLLLVLEWLAGQLGQGRRLRGFAPLRLYRTTLDVPLLALLLLVLLSAIFSSYGQYSIEAISLFLSYLALFYITLYTVRTRKQQRTLVSVLIGVAVLLALVGFLKRLDLLPVSWWTYPHQLSTDYSISGPFGNRNHLAGYLEMVIPLVVGLFLAKKRRSPVFSVLLCLTVFLVAAHIFSFSRGGWLSLSLGLTAMALVLLTQERFQGKMILSLLLVGFFAVLLFILSSREIVERILTLTTEQTIMEIGGRRAIWAEVFTMIGDFPLLGAGPGSFATVYLRYHPPVLARFFEAHNDYLHFTAEIGLAFIPLLCLLLAAIFRQGWRRMAGRGNQLWSITLSALTGLVAILVHSCVDFNLHIPANALLATVLVALIFCRVDDGLHKTWPPPPAPRSLTGERKPPAR
jgi:O-antigen ligase